MRGEKMQDIDSTSPAIGPADPGSRQSGQLTEGIRQLLGSIKGAALLKQQTFEHRTVSLVPFPVRHRVHQPVA